MDLYALSIVILVLAALAGIFFKKYRSRPEIDYRLNDGLFTDSERVFLEALEEAAGDRFAVYGKVHLADIFSPRTYTHAAMDRITGRHVGFVLCNRKDRSFACGIELDESSRSLHEARDEFLDRVFESDMLPLLRFKAASSYNAGEIRARIFGILGISEPPARPAAPAAAARVTEIKVEKAAVEEPGIPLPDVSHDTSLAAPVEHEAPVGQPEQTVEPIIARAAPVQPEIPKALEKRLCPKCSSEMTRRKAASGPQAGKLFWVCKNYKECRTAIPIAS
jgi:hypothetical protein